MTFTSPEDKTGGSAFPHNPDEVELGSEGMSLLDYFAVSLWQRNYQGSQWSLTKWTD